jgi:hypothetical protein
MTVIELIPAEIVVRIDRREKLACSACESEVVCAPIGDKVAEGGRTARGAPTDRGRVQDARTEILREGFGNIHRHPDASAARCRRSARRAPRISVAGPRRTGRHSPFCTASAFASAKSSAFNLGTST